MSLRSPQADATELQILEEGLRETGNVMPKAEVNVSRTRTLWAPTNKDDIITAVER